MTDPTMRQLKYFVTVSQTGNFRQAASKLGISQPTLSAQIVALETALEVSLFERSRAGTILTPAGRDMLAEARALTSRFDAFIGHIRGGTTHIGGTHRLGVPPTLGPYFLPDTIGDIHRTFPNLRLYVRENPPRELQENLLEGGHDLILSPLPLIADSFTAHPLFCEPLQLIVSSDHPFAERSSVTKADLEGVNILALEEKHHLSNQVRQLSNSIGATLLRDFEGTSLDTLRQMVATGVGLSFLPALYVRSEISRRQDVVAVPVEGLTEARTIALAWRASSPHAHLYRMIANCLQKTVAHQMQDTVELC